MAASLWKDKYIIRIYELAKAGLAEAKMSKILGISYPTFLSWKKKKKLFKLALQAGRRAFKTRGNEVLNFRDYVYQRLTPELQKVWGMINKVDKLGATGGELIEAILSKRGVRVRQHLFLFAWTSSNFSISAALRKVNISRGTFDLWKRDPEFTKLIDEINWHKKNFFEDHVIKLIAGGDAHAAISVNEAYNADRGYSKKFNLEVSGGTDDSVVSVDVMDLPIKTRKAILKSVRKRRKESVKT